MQIAWAYDTQHLNDIWMRVGSMTWMVLTVNISLLKINLFWVYGMWILIMTVLTTLLWLLNQQSFHLCLKNMIQWTETWDLWYWTEIKTVNWTELAEFSHY